MNGKLRLVRDFILTGLIWKDGTYVRDGTAGWPPEGSASCASGDCGTTNWKCSKTLTHKTSS